MRHSLPTALILVVSMPLAACSRSATDRTVSIEGRHYHVFDKQRITGQGWTALSVRYEWNGPENAAVLDENARRLLTVVGPEAIRDGYQTVIFMAVATDRATSVNVGYQYVDGSWSELKKR